MVRLSKVASPATAATYGATYEAVQTAMPKGWQSTDIGAPVTAGTADYSTGSKSFYLDGAGQDEFVLIVQGSSARLTPETEKLPVDCTIIGIVDSVNVENKTIFSAREEASGGR